MTVQTATRTVDAAGFPTQTWATLSDEFMARADLSGRERQLAGQVSAAADVRFEMAYRSDMDPELVTVTKDRRLLADGRVYDIVGASIVGRHEAIALMALAKVG